MRTPGAQKGFTLIELIAAMVIVGFIGVTAGLGLSSFMESWLLTRETTALSQKAQIAMARLNVELMHVTASEITSGTSTSIRYQADFPSSGPGDLNTTTEDHTIHYSQSDQALYYRTSGVDRILADRVTGFRLRYFDTYNGAAENVPDAGTRLVEVRLTLDGPDNAPQTFLTRIPLASGT